jgi:hypothetical protein
LLKEQTTGQHRAGQHFPGDGIPLEEKDYKRPYDGKLDHALERKDLVKPPFDQRPFQVNYRYAKQPPATLAVLRALVHAGPVVVGEWNSLGLNQIGKF